MPTGDTGAQLWIEKCTKEYQKRIAALEKEMETAGFFRKRNIYKHLKRLRKEFAEFQKNISKKA